MRCAGAMLLGVGASVALASMVASVLGSAIVLVGAVVLGNAVTSDNDGVAISDDGAGVVCVGAGLSDGDGRPQLLNTRASIRHVPMNIFLEHIDNVFIIDCRLAHTSEQNEHDGVSSGAAKSRHSIHQKL